MCSCLLLSMGIRMSASTGFAPLFSLLSFCSSPRYLRSSVCSFPLQTLLFTPSASNFNFLGLYIFLKSSLQPSLSLSSAFSFVCLPNPQCFWAPWLFMTVSLLAVYLCVPGSLGIRALSVFLWIREGWGPSPGHKIPDNEKSQSVCELVPVFLTCRSAASAWRLSAH